MNVLLVGVGRWGKNHLRVLSSIREVNLFVSDLEESVAKILPAYHIPETNFSTNYRDFLGKVDVVFVVTPANLHLDIALDAMGSGCDVFIEKPISTNYKDAMKICEEAERRNLIVQVGHIFRFHPITNKVLLPTIRSGELGKIRYMKGSFKGFKRPRMDVGVTLTDTIHFVDLFSYALGRWPGAVYGKTMDVLGRGMDDLSLSILYFDGNEEVVGFIESGYFQPRTLREVVISGNRKSAILNYRENKVTIKENTHIKRENGWEAKVGETKVMEIESEEPLLIETKSFLSCVAERKTPICTALDGAKAVRVVEKIYESSRKKRDLKVEF